MIAAVIGLAASPIAEAAAESPRERGAYLVNTLAACANCHTPKTPSGLGPSLAGGSQFGSPEAPVYAPNITPDSTTGIGRWTDRQIVDALRFGVRPDGSRIGPPMPQMAYHFMSDDDLRAIVAYLRSVPPSVHAVPTSSRKRMPPVAWEMLRQSPARHSDDPAAQGHYIATALSHCTECHTPVPLSAPDVAAHLDKGGRVFKTPKGPLVAPGIRANDLMRFTDAELAGIITKGVRPDGSKLEGPMPVKAYAGYRPADLGALIAFLRSDQSTSER